ncbi:MAG: patatin-like phospholipase family protein [Pseudomonadota bacterium]
MIEDVAFARRALGDVFGIPADADTLLDDLSKELEILHLNVEDTLVTEGEASDAIYVLLRGRLTAHAATREGGESFLGEIRRGETIGEIGVIQGTPRGATVRVSRTSTVARISADAFQRMLTAHSGLGLAIARTLISRSERATGPRHPGFVPETLCLMAVTGGIDLATVAQRLADTLPGAVTVIAEGADLARAQHQIHEAEQEGHHVFILSDGGNAAWQAMAVAEADEVVRIADATHDPAPGGAETSAERPANAVLPRHTLLLVHPESTQSPRGTVRWLASRKIDRHLHMRLERDDDVGRVGRLLTGRAVGLALAGGGARGAAHIGAIRALEEAGIVPDIVGGTSIGAAMAAWYAMGLRSTDLEAAARTVFVDSGGPTRDWNLLPLISLVKGRQTRDLGIEAIRRATGTDIDIEDTWTPFFCLTANYTAQRQVVHQSGPLWRALTATYAIPGVLPPVLIDGELHVDGGVVNNLPVDVLEEVGAARTIAVDLLGEARKPLAITEIPSNGALLVDKLRPRRKRRYKLPGLMSTLLNSTVLSSLNRQRDMSERADLCLRPELPRVGLLDWKKFPDTIEYGYQSATEQLAALPAEIRDTMRAA